MRISDWSSDVCSSDLQVFLFNPTDRQGRTARYNPLAYIDRSDPDDVIIELQKIATMLFTTPERGEAFWANGARTGFAGVGAWLAETSDEPLTMGAIRSDEHTSELQSLMRISYAVF